MEDSNQKYIYKISRNDHKICSYWSAVVIAKSEKEARSINPGNMNLPKNKWDLYDFNKNKWSDDGFMWVSDPNVLKVLKIGIADPSFENLTVIDSMSHDG